MKDNIYLPEGRRVGKPENDQFFASVKMLERAQREERILEATADACTGEELDLSVPLGNIRGIIPKKEAALEAAGDTEVRDIAVITRVGRPVCFVVTDILCDGGVVTAYLSRRQAQMKCRDEYVSRLLPGDVIDATVTHLDPFGAFLDIGCGMVSLLCIDCISVSRISHPSERLKKGQRIKAVVKSRDDATGRIFTTLRELLGTWEENADNFTVGNTVPGMVRSVEDYGIFVELAPNLAGLAERKNGVEPGDACAVYIKNIIRERMKVKLSIVDTHAPPSDIPPLVYYVDPGMTHMDRWRYSPLVCPKIIETIFK